MFIEVIPAYGRDYKNAKDARQSWATNKDWLEATSRKPINRNQAEQMGLRVILRFNQWRNTTTTKA